MVSQVQWQTLEALYSSVSQKDKSLLVKLHSLLTIESLTQGLESVDPQFSVNLLSLEESDHYYSENMLKVKKLCRKVTLELSGQAMVYAESLCDIDAKQCCEYLHCGTNSLGRRLFSDIPLKRTVFSYALFPATVLPFFIRKELDLTNEIICARRSYFMLEGSPLFITEWYLPPLITKIDNLALDLVEK